MRSVENEECGKCGVWKTRSVENEECGKCGVWKMRSVENSAPLLHWVKKNPVGAQSTVEKSCHSILGSRPTKCNNDLRT